MDGEPKDDKGSVKERVMSIVAPLPLRFVYEVLRQVCRMPFGGRPDRLEEVKHTFVEYLNTRRPQRARRLFTDLFAPILVSDGVLLRAKRPIPGAVQRADAAGLWAGFSRYGFPDLVAKVQGSLDAMAADALLDDVFKSPEAQELQRRMAEEAVRYLNRLLAEGRQVVTFLDFVNRKRLVEARRMALFLESLAPVDRPFLVFVRDYLAAGEACAAYLRHHLGEPGDGAITRPAETAWSELEAERRAETMIRAVEEMGETLVPSDCRSELPVLVALATLNVGRQYGAAALYVRESGSPDGVTAYVVEALLGHFAACCVTIAEVLKAALKLDERLPGASVKLTGREMAEIDDVMHRLALVMPALIVGGILENRQTEPVFRYLWDELARFLGERLAVVVAQRITVDVSTRRNATLDHRDMVWLARLIWTWHQLARTYDQSFGMFDKWRDHILEDVRIAVEQASRLEDGETLAERLGHLLRLNEITAVFGQRITRHLSLASQNVARMMLISLEALAPETDPEERALLIDFIALARAEKVRSKHWHSEELGNLLELARARGL